MSKENIFSKFVKLPAKSRQNRQAKIINDRSGERQARVLSKKTSFYIREAYKALRTNIIFSLPIEGCKKIVVTSSVQREGKSTNCLNLAITFAETGARVIIIDCDLRKPTLNRLLGADASPGISNVLVGLCKKEDVINKTEFENLDAIYSGDIPPNPAELLGSDRMQELIEELSEHYDYIFFDTAPVNAVTDTAILSKFVSGILMVVLQNSTEKDSLESAVRQLDFVGAKIVGFILNGVGYNNAYRYHRYGKRYGYGYGYGYGRYGYSKYGYGYGSVNTSNLEQIARKNKKGV